MCIRDSVKCFDISSDIPGRGMMKQIHFYYKRKKIMDDMLRYSRYALDYSMDMNYPGQFLLKPGASWNMNIMDDNTMVYISFEDMEILKGRVSRNRKCTPNSDNVAFDDMVLQKHVATKGCWLPYMQPSSKYPLCDTKEMRTSSIYSYQQVRKNYYVTACERLSKLHFKPLKTPMGYPFDTRGIVPRDIWAIQIQYPEYAKIITQSKEIDIHGLIGNIGGYIGLFLGNLLLQN